MTDATGFGAADARQRRAEVQEEFTRARLGHERGQHGLDHEAVLTGVLRRVGERVDGGGVGAACGANLIPLVIPCHRVVASGGIGGFVSAA